LIRALLAIALALWAQALAAQEDVVGALSQNRVSITANFDGSEIFVFGAVKREAPAPTEDGPLEVVITVRGPTLPVTVRRKERVVGVWANRDTMVVDEAPTYYAIATTGPLTEIMSETERLRHRIGFDKVVRAIGGRAEVEDPANFIAAVARVRQAQGLYQSQEGSVDLREETLFATSVALPASLVEGEYTTAMYLLRDRKVVGTTETSIIVRKEGCERWVYTLAHEHALIYGLLSLAVALIAGWLASELFRLMRR
jgi:uncharacterized protein (TIGR02186 family)